MNLTDSMYWCDVCNSSHIGNNDEITTRYYETNQKQKFQQHIRSKKHIKLTGALEALTTIKCEHCNRKFTEEGYLIHTKRNEPLWKLKKLGIASVINMGCNNFNVGKRRYKSIDEFISKTAPDKPKKRTAVGKWSPITGITRPPNKPNRTAEQKKKDVENEYKLCNDCNGMFNVELERSDKELMKITGLTMCECQDPPNLELEIEEVAPLEQTAEEIKDMMTKKIAVGKDANGDIIMKDNPNYNPNSRSVYRIKDHNRVELNETDEILIDRYGTQLPFDETCDSCYNPINYEYSSKLLNKLDIDVCNCDDTDTDSD